MLWVRTYILLNILTDICWKHVIVAKTHLVPLISWIYCMKGTKHCRLDLLFLWLISGALPFMCTFFVSATILSYGNSEWFSWAFSCIVRVAYNVNVNSKNFPNTVKMKVPFYCDAIEEIFYIPQEPLSERFLKEPFL